MNLKDTYDKIAVDWHKDHIDDDWWIGGLEKFASLLPVGAAVLDAGCAGGVKSKALVVKGFHVTGIDFAPNFIGIAKQEVPEAEFRVLDVRNVASLEKEFDGIFLEAVLLHFSKKEVPEIISELITRLKTGGFIHISVKESREGQTEEMQTENDYGYEYERFFSFFSQHELQGILKRSGLEIISSDVAQSGKTRWLQVIAKKL